MDARASYPRQLAYDPFRPPDWRWQRANWLIANGRYVSRRRDDDLTGRVVRYLRASNRKRKAGHIGRHYPDIRAAHQLHQSAATKQCIVEARILAGQTSAEIARLAKIPARVIDTYEAVFFCCRDRLKARDWIACQCLRTSGLGSDEVTSAEVLLKTFAYHGGIHAFDAFAPYLLGDIDINDGSLDLATPQGRWEQLVRLNLAVQLLPHRALTLKKQSAILLLLQESTRKPLVPAISRPLVRANGDFPSAEVLLRLTLDALRVPKRASDATNTLAVAQAG